jgi:hypothetical protein
LMPVSKVKFILALGGTYSGLQNCPNVCMNFNDLHILTLLINQMSQFFLYLKLHHLFFWQQVKSCDLSKNLLFYELNNIFTHWGSFETSTYSTL